MIRVTNLPRTKVWGLVPIHSGRPIHVDWWNVQQNRQSTMQLRQQWYARYPRHCKNKKVACYSPASRHAQRTMHGMVRAGQGRVKERG